MVFRAGFIPAVIAPAAIGLALGKRMLADEPYVSEMGKWKNNCSYPTTLGPLRDIICVVEPFFERTIANPISVQVLSLLGMLALVNITYLLLQGGKGGRSALSHPLVTIAIVAVGQAIGLGVITPIVLPFLLAVTKTIAPARQGLSAPPTSTYTIVTCAIQLAILFLTFRLVTIKSVDPDLFPYVNMAWQPFPFYYLPLAFLPESRGESKDNQGPMTTQNVFSFLRWVAIPAHWYSVLTIANLYLNKNVKYDSITIWLAHDYAGVLTAFLATIAVDAFAGDAKGSIGPLNMFANFLLAGPASTAAEYFRSKEAQASKRAALKQDKKL